MPISLGGTDLNQRNNVVRCVEKRGGSSWRESVGYYENPLNEVQHELLKNVHKKEEYDTVADGIFLLNGKGYLTPLKQFCE